MNSAVEMKPAQARVVGEVVEARHLLGQLDGAARGGDRGGMPGVRRLWFGLHRLHGRKPARSAAAQESWKATFLRKASRAAQDGRQ